MSTRRNVEPQPVRHGAREPREAWGPASGEQGRATPAKRPRPRWDRPSWERNYTTALPLLDAVMITAAGFLALAVRNPRVEVTPAQVRYDVVAAALAPVWVTVLALSRAYEP